MPKAQLFKAGGSQAVRLPAAFRFEGDEVDVRRHSVTGDVVGDARDIDPSLGMPCPASAFMRRIEGFC